MARREWNVPKDGLGGRPVKPAGVRRNPRNHAGTGAIRQEKTPTESGWGFDIGGTATTKNITQAIDIA